MEPKFQNSFIPKKPMGLTQSVGVQVSHPTNIFSVIAGAIFVIALLISGGLFAYSKILDGQIKEVQVKILDARGAYEPEKIKELIDIDKKITSSNDLLRNHVAVSEVLSLLENLTLKKMRFTSFEYTKNNNKPTVSITGDIQTYNALARQQEFFASTEFIRNPRFTDFNLGDNGYISVKFSADLDQSLISYKRIMDKTITN
ncbi:MAG: hypothetical protein QG579_559 [Patescibacteria group bacterium]|jgi:hypothetical protein|nr:hypothetical protein [Patescibacteria group bacterium]